MNRMSAAYCSSLSADSRLLATVPGREIAEEDEEADDDDEAADDDAAATGVICHISISAAAKCTLSAPLKSSPASRVLLYFTFAGSVPDASVSISKLTAITLHPVASFA